MYEHFSFFFRRILLIFGDSILYYGALYVALWLRYGSVSQIQLVTHLVPFSIGFAFWLLAAYIGGLYELGTLKNTPQFRGTVISLLGFLFGFLVLMFYTTPSLEIEPKTILVLFIAIFGVSLLIWRYGANRLLLARTIKTQILLLGSNRSIEEVYAHLEKNPQLGYEVALWLKDGLQNKTGKELRQMVEDKKIGLIVVPAHIKKQARAARIAYQNLIQGTPVMSLADFYQQIFRRISLPELEEVWFLDNLALRQRSYQLVKRIIEASVAFSMIVVALPFMLCIALLIMLTSRGPAIYIQRRVGQGGIPFNLYKFRSMYATADKNPDANASKPIWSSGSNDNRITFVGRILRATHLDELPQLYNILVGNMSFVGPRPERPEFDKELEQDIPFYELRYLVKPGITGWAQINYPYGASVEDAYQKLQYDIYYLTRRSPILDVLIVIKTLKRFFVQVKN